MEPTIDGEALSPRMRGGNWLQQRPVISSILIAILAGLLLQMYNIIEFPELVDSFLPDNYVGARLIDFGFRMTMGALLALVAVPLLLGYYRAGWLNDYLSLMRFSTGTEPGKTLEQPFYPFLLSQGCWSLSLMGLASSAPICRC